MNVRNFKHIFSCFMRWLIGLFHVTNKLTVFNGSYLTTLANQYKNQVFYCLLHIMLHSVTRHYTLYVGVLRCKIWKYWEISAFSKIGIKKKKKKKKKKYDIYRTDHTI